MSITTTIPVELFSSVTADVDSRMWACPDSNINAHIVTAPRDLVSILGAAGPNPAELDYLMVIDVAGATGDYNLAQNLAAGFWRIIGRPNWVAVRIETDSAIANYRVFLQITPED
jgi:hypothetical protein